VIRTTRPIVLITVQYANPADTSALLKSVDSLDDSASCRVIVVDNSPDRARDAKPVGGKGHRMPVDVLVAPQNLYYWGGAAFAIDTIRRDEGKLPPWVIICNNDTTIEQADFLSRLANLDPGAFPIIAPAITSLASQRNQNPMLEKPPTYLQRLKWSIYDLGYPVARAMLATHRAVTPKNPERNSDSETRRRIYAPHGAFVILSSTFFARGGDLDTQVAMFAEELTLAETARALDLPVWYLPELRVTHAEHSTTGSGLTREKYALERMARRRYYHLRRSKPQARDWQLQDPAR
jgi:GT2 family glycosyltransferase